MKKTSHLISILFFIFFLPFIEVVADPPGPPDPGGSPAGNGQPVGAPLDHGSVVILVILGAGYGAWKLASELTKTLPDRGE